MGKPFHIADWRIDPDRNLISRGNTTRHLEPRVMDLLVYLSRRPGEVIRRDLIFRDVWHDSTVGDSALMTAISSLRRALGDNPHKPRFIETVPKRGYRLIASTSARSAALAILPFRDISMESDQAFLADGITDLILGELGRIPRIRVISWPSVSRFRNSEQSVQTIAEQLGAGFIVDGSVWRSGKQVRVSVRLNDVDRQDVLWSENFEFDLAEIFRMQQQIASQIAHSVSGHLSARTANPPENNENRPEALLAYLRGRFHWNKMSPEHFQRALEYFEQAVMLDPAYGPAYGGISDVWGAFGYWGIRPPSEIREKVWQPLRNASQYGEHWAEIQAQTGAACFYLDRDWNQAEIHFSRAIELNPNLGHAHMLYGLFAMTLKRADAIDRLQTAVRLDPVNPVMQLAFALLAMSLDQFDEALECLRRLSELDPDHPPGNQLRTNLAWFQNDPGAPERESRLWAADPEVSKIFERHPMFKNPRELLLEIAGCLHRRAETEYVQAMQIARLYALGGDGQTALDILEQALRSGDLMQIDFLQSDCAWYNLRSGPRFQAMLRTIDLPQ